MRAGAVLRACVGAAPTASGPHRAKLIDGKAIAKEIMNDVSAKIKHLTKKTHVVPGLATILVGDRRDSVTYVNTKNKNARECGIATFHTNLPFESTESQVIECVQQTAQNPDIHAILVQLPLPPHIDEARVLHHIPIEKDVEGYSATSMGHMVLSRGNPLVLPCTPLACLSILDRVGAPLCGKRAVVIGRSDIVGMPLVNLLIQRDATVTCCHKQTIHLEEEVRRADIVISATGCPSLIRGPWLKPGSIVVDVGIVPIPDASKKAGFRLVGDVCFEEALSVASYVTPVPGGVGPVTVAMLLHNTLTLALHATQTT